MELTFRRQRHALLLILVYVAGILAACGGEPPTAANCYIYDFTLEPVTSTGAPINLIAGTWLPGQGIMTSGNEIVANWNEAFYASPKAVYIAVQRPSGVSGAIDVDAIAGVFGRELNISTELPDGTDEGTGTQSWDDPNPVSSTAVNGTIQTDKPLIVTSITIVVDEDEPSPFPVNSCAPPPPTEAPTSTASASPSQTPSATSTPTGTLPSPTPGCFASSYSGDSSGAYASYWNTGYWVGSGGGQKFRYPWTAHTLASPSAITITFTLPSPASLTSVKVDWARIWTGPPGGSKVAVIAQPGNVALMNRFGSENASQPYTALAGQTVSLPNISVQSIQFVYTGFVNTAGAFGPNRVTIQGCSPDALTATPTSTLTGPTTCNGTFSATSDLWEATPPENDQGAIGDPEFYFVENGTADLVFPSSGSASVITVAWAKLPGTVGSGASVNVYAQPDGILLMTRTATGANLQTTATATITVNLSPPLTMTHLEFIYSGFTSGAFGPASVTTTCGGLSEIPTVFPTRTPLPTLIAASASPTGIGVNTSTPMPTNTPLNTPTPTFTITSTLEIDPTEATAIPTSTPLPTRTLISVPTPKFTTTPWATYAGPRLTPIPGTPIFTGIQTPRVGTLASTPFRQATALPVPGDLDDLHPSIRGYLQTAVMYVNGLPRDIGGLAPSISGTFPTFAGYAKWAMSGVSLQEIFGQQIYPIPQHIFYGVAVIISFSIIFMTVKVVLFFIKLALWIIRFILKIIPFIG